MVHIADIIGRGLVLRSSNTLLTNIKTYTGKRQSGRGEYLRLFFVCIMITPILISGCHYTGEGPQARSTAREANDFFNQENYEASLPYFPLKWNTTSLPGFHLGDRIRITEIVPSSQSQQLEQVDYVFVLGTEDEKGQVQRELGGSA